MPTSTSLASRPVRSDGWTMERRRLFLAALANGLSVAAACASVGMSREAAYKARRRDTGFAHRWALAQTSARRAARKAFLDRLPDDLRTRLAQHGRSA